MYFEEDDGYDEDLCGDGCPYGFEFCSDPQTRELGLCTTECSDYMREVEAQAKETTTK